VTGNMKNFAIFFRTKQGLEVVRSRVKDQTLISSKKGPDFDIQGFVQFAKTKVFNTVARL
jgi:hypothetical protein